MRAVLAGRDDNGLAFARLDPGYGFDVFGMRHQHEVARARVIANQSKNFLLRCGCLFLVLRQRIQRGGLLDQLVAKGESRGFKAAAVAARKNFFHRFGAGGEKRSYAARLLASAVRQVALGTAVLDVETGGIASAGCVRMNEEDYLPAVAQQSPSGFGGGGERYGKQEKGGNHGCKTKHRQSFAFPSI